MDCARAPGGYIMFLEVASSLSPVILGKPNRTSRSRRIANADPTGAA